MSEDQDQLKKEDGMFKFEDEELSSPRKMSGGSPEHSPRDKKQKMFTQELGSTPPSSTKPIFVAASPPKFVTLEDIMREANGISNMVLAHEIAVDNDFKLNQPQLPENSLEKRVTNIMKRAFWDALKEKLEECPPDYCHAFVLLKEVKETLEDLLLPQHRTIKAQINEVLDLKLIQQQVENNALNFQHYADFVIVIMSKLCSPARDEKIEELKEMKDVVPLFKGILELLEVMKMDMANFTIQQMRPIIQQQSVEYEKNKFTEFLKQSKENNVDGLQYTKNWLERHGLELYYKDKQAQSVTGESGPSTSSQSAEPIASNSSAALLTPLNIMNYAYLELLNWPSNQIYPETMLMDEKRFTDLELKLKQLTLSASIILVTFNTVGSSIAGVAGLKEKLKDVIDIILKDVSERNLEDAMKNLAIQIEKEVNVCLTKRSYPPLDKKRCDMLTGQLHDVQKTTHSVHQLMQSRVNAFIKDLISGKTSSEVKIPAGFSTVIGELKGVCGQYLRLVSHNRQVYGHFYADIIGTIMKKYENVEEDQGTPV